MKPDHVYFNFSDKRQRDGVLAHIRTLTGMWELTLKRPREQRSLEQNSYAHGVVFPYIAAGLRNAWGEDIDAIGAKEFLKARFLSVPVTNRRTGEVAGYRVRSTADLDKAEFAAFVDQCVAFAAEYLGVEIPPADRFRELEKTPFCGRGRA